MLALAVLFSAGAAYAAGHGNSPQVSANVQVNDPQHLFPNDLPSRNTTTIAASEDGQDLLAGWDDLQGFCGPPTNRACTPPAIPGISGFGFSTDGGQTWTDGGSPFPVAGSQTAGHPWVDRGGDDTNPIYFFTSRMRALSTGSTGIGIHRGHFGAGTFVFDDGQIINSSAPGDFYSRQAIAAAKDGSGAAYIVLSNIIRECNIDAFGWGQIEVWRTHDNGDTWQGPVVVSPDASLVTDPNDPLCGAAGPFQIAPAISIGDHGEVYVVWQYGPDTNAAGVSQPTSKIAFSRSLDGGVTFSAPVFLVSFNNMRENPPVGYAKNRMNDQPRIAVATTGPNHGRIYVGFAQSLQPVSTPITVQSAVSADLALMYSDDQGQTWSTPQGILAPPPPTGIKRFWPTIAIRPGGEVDILYLESQETQRTVNPTDEECNVPMGAGQRRRGPLSSLVDTYLVQSGDGGATFGAPIRVSDTTSSWCPATTNSYLFASFLHSNAGDYLGLATSGNRSYAVWPDSRNNFFDVFFASVKGTNQ
jgi:hypothetical protein